MSVLDIVIKGDESLTQKAQAVTDFKLDKVQENVSDMIDTMRHYQGVGLAAPQIGLLQRIIVLEVANNKRYPQAENIELDILINPEILECSQQTEIGWEGCLSIPGFRGEVLRPVSITYQALNLTQELLIKTVYGFHARIIQHEIDHLNGILFTQRMTGSMLKPEKNLSF